MLAMLFPLQAHFDSASVLGAVRDPSSAAMPNVSMTLNTETGITAVTHTDANGGYQFPNLRLGNYQITDDDIVLTVNARRRIDIALTAGAVSEKVNFGLQERFARIWRERTSILLNKTNFESPPADCNRGSFGLIRSAYAARQMQLALRVAF